MYISSTKLSTTHSTIKLTLLARFFFSPERYRKHVGNKRDHDADGSIEQVVEIDVRHEFASNGLHRLRYAAGRLTDAPARDLHKMRPDRIR